MKNLKTKTETKKILTVIFSLLKTLAAVVIVFLFYDKFQDNWSELKNYNWNINYLFLFLSFVFHLIAFTAFSKIWCILISAFGHHVHLKHAFKIAYITNLGRYIPGKIWPVIGMVYLAKQLDIPEETSVTSWVIAMIFTIPAAFIVVFLAILFSPDVYADSMGTFLNSGFYFLSALLLAGSLLLLFAPNKTFVFFNYVLKKLKRPLLTFQLNIQTAFIIYFGYTVCWILYGFAFWLLVSSLITDISIPIIPTIGTFVLAYQVGYLAFFAPGGIGVREVIISTLLFPILGPITSGIAIAARVWNMIVELLATLIAWLIRLPNGKRF